MAARALDDDSLLCVLQQVPSSQDRKAFSQASRTCWELEACSRTTLTLGPGIAPASLGRLLSRFCNLRSLTLNYLGWRPTSGPQLGDEALFMVASLCPRLENLSLSYCGFVTDQGVAALAACRGLLSLRLHFVPRVTSRGLLALAQGCPALEFIHLERCPKVDGTQWLEAVGQRTGRTVQQLWPSVPPLSWGPTTPTLSPVSQASPLPSSSIPSSAPSSASVSPLLLPLGHPSLDAPLDNWSLSLQITPWRRSEKEAGRPSDCAPVRSLTVSRCPLVQERDLAWLGKAGWEALEELHFEAEKSEVSQEDETLAPAFEEFAGDLDLSRLRVLNLKNCPRMHREGLGLVLSRLCAQRKNGEGEKRRNPQSWGLRELHLVHCPGLNDADMKLLLSTFAHSLQALSLSLIKWLGSLPVAALPSARAEPEFSPQCGCDAQEQQVLEQMQQPWPEMHAQAGHQQAGQQSSRAVTTASLAHIAEHCMGLRQLELVCKDEFASSAKLFEGFADSAICAMVTKLQALLTLRIGAGLHVTDKTIKGLRVQHRGTTFLEV